MIVVLAFKQDIDNTFHKFEQTIVKEKTYKN